MADSSGKDGWAKNWAKLKCEWAKWKVSIRNHWERFKREPNDHTGMNLVTESFRSHPYLWAHIVVYYMILEKLIGAALLGWLMYYLFW